jgi:elongation factor G
LQNISKDPELTMSESSRFHLIEMKIEPKSGTDMGMLASALALLVRSDPNVFSSVDAESGEILIGGVSEFHLEGIVEALISQGVAINIGAPQVAYRETITRKTEVDYTYKKQTGGTGQFARVILEIEPNERGAGYEFKDRIVGGAVPKEYIPGVEKGLNSVMGAGILAGFPIVDIKIALTDGAYHEVDSSAIAFEIAARMALRESLQKAGAILLEPIMKVEVSSPEDYLGGVIGDLNSRRGQILGTSARGNAQIVNAMVPLANMFGYVAQLSSLSNGRATFTMAYSHYQAVITPDPDDFPPAIALRA